MKRIITLLLAVAGLSVLLAGCGGAGSEEKNVVLAIAFRLDGGAALMAAYVGDPAKDPFALPAGRYYAEALNEDDVLVSLGAVDVAEGGAVAIPESFEEAGGVADSERAEPLITVANFLVDVELAEYAYLDIATGGFTLPPFDPAVELEAASVRELFDLQRQIGEQKDAVLEALSEIEGRAAVSTARSYVRSAAGASAPGDFDKIESDAQKFFDLMLASPERQRERALGLIGRRSNQEEMLLLQRMPEDLRVVDGREVSRFSEWVDLVREGKLDDKLPELFSFIEDAAGVFAAALLILDKFPPETERGTFIAMVWENMAVIQQSGWVSDRRAAWERYARDLAAELGGKDPAQVRQRLEERIRSNIEELFPDSPEAVAWVLDHCLDRLARAVELESATASGGQAPAATPTPPTPQATPDTSWIEDFVARVGARMMEEGYPDELTARVMPALYDCLMEAVLGGKSKEEAVAGCAATFGIEPTPQATATGAPEASETPESAPRGVTAVGKFVRLDLGLALEGYDCTLAENTMSLTFNTGGGSATGQGYVRYECRGYPQCPTSVWESSAQFTGTYDPGSRGFAGTLDMTIDSTVYGLHGNDPEAEYCDEFTGSDAGTGTGWRATLQDGTVRGEVLLAESTGDPSHGVEFELTVQGQ